LFAEEAHVCKKVLNMSRCERCMEFPEF